MAEFAAYEDVQEAVKSVDLGMNKSSRVFPFAMNYNNGVTLNVVVTELSRNISLAMACVFICTLFLIANLVTTLLVCCTVSITLMNVAGKNDTKKFLVCIKSILIIPSQVNIFDNLLYIAFDFRFYAFLGSFNRYIGCRVAVGCIRFSSGLFCPYCSCIHDHPWKISR